jgi:hypothetical protein
MLGFMLLGTGKWSFQVEVNVKVGSGPMFVC